MAREADPTSKGKTAGKRAKGVAKGGKEASSGLPRFRPNQRSGIDEIGQKIINDLMNNDPIAERLQNPIFNFGPEPEMEGRHAKSTQLQRLLSNIPEGSSSKEAKSDRAKLKQASRSFGYAKVKAVDGKWLIKGMKSTLYHHQLLGAQWMIQRELDEEGGPYGGLLADGMGLGKTVQTLACMVGNPPGDGDRKRGAKATLIVVPSSVIEQWLDEIRNHVEVSCFPKIMRYRATSKIPMEVLTDLDIVVCSYHEVMQQFPYPNQKDREIIDKIGFTKWKKTRKSTGDLFGVYWYRVVLDEAHAIKNNCARTSLACQGLRSIYRWCLTGTPLLNRLEE